MRPAAPQTKPAVQGRHCAALARPAAVEKVPGAQGCGAEEPAGQKDPAAQAAPVTPSVGLATAAPPKQRLPAAQAAVGAARPVVAQNCPGGQASVGAVSPPGQ